MTEWVEVAQEDLDIMHDRAERLYMKLERIGLYDDAGTVKSIKNIIESARFYKESG